VDARSVLDRESVNLEPVEQHRERLVLCARRVLGDAHEAEDVAQEVLIRAPHDATEGWLFAVCYRVAIDRLRARQRRKKALAGLAERPRATEGDLPFDLEAVRASLATLAEPYRSAVTLRYLEGLDFPELARRLGTLERTGRTWVGRGLSRLREELAERGEP
jgi:RNA polymerase sigma-70 factor (ECF subfamily)